MHKAYGGSITDAYSQWGNGNFDSKTFCDVTLLISRDSFFTCWAFDGDGRDVTKAISHAISWVTIQGIPKDKIRFIADVNDLTGFWWFAITVVH